MSKKRTCATQGCVKREVVWTVRETEMEEETTEEEETGRNHFAKESGGAGFMTNGHGKQGVMRRSIYLTFNMSAGQSLS